MEINFIGGSYEGRSKDLNSQRCVNWYPVIGGQMEADKAPIAMFPTPGLKTWHTSATTAVVRGLHKYSTADMLYAVIGDTLYSINTSSVATALGTLNSSTGVVYMADNGNVGNQLMIVDGATGYIYNTSSGAFAAIADADFPGAGTLTWQDGYFIISRPSTGQFWISASYDGTSWDATDYATAESDPDNLLRVFSDHREVWLFGPTSIEVYYNSGATFPFARKLDETIERGLGATASVAKEDNTVFWLDDQGLARRAAGYKPEIISTRQIEYQWSSYSTISDAIGFTYIQEGHTFYVLTFPTANKTWVYDISTGFWHERASYPSPYTGRWRANCHAFFNRLNLVGDFENGKIYELSLDTYKDNAKIIKRTRTTKFLHKDRKKIFHKSLEIDFESGVGLVTSQGSDPQAMLSWTDDGHTWSNEHWRSIGKIGEYDRRSVWNRLGSSRNRAYKLEIADPVKAVIIGAHLESEMGRF